MTALPPDQTLSALRVDIDRIDAAMHALLIERGAIIEQLIAVKSRQGGGSAFRPGREAEMMRRLAERHRGPLPLDTVESIWRVIIATFTFVQAPYTIHVDMAGGDAAMRDTARFHFGFTVPLHPAPDALAVIAAVAAAEGDLGIVPVAQEPPGAPWWEALSGPDAPRIIARLPFVERRDHPAGRPVFVIARPGAAAAVREIVLLLDTDPLGEAAPEERVAGVEVIGRAGASRLLAVPEPACAAAVGRLMEAAPHRRIVEIGSHAAPFHFDADRPAPL